MPGRRALYPTTFRVDAPGGPVGGRTVGDGPPVVLVAGLGATSGVWGDLPFRLARRFRVIAPDNRGVGRSRDGEPFTIDRAVADLEAIASGHGVEQVSMLGASLGGTLGLAFAAAHPGRVARLVVASCAARPSPYTRRLFESFRASLAGPDPRPFGELLTTLAFAPEFHRRFTGLVGDATALYGPDPDDLPGVLAQLDHLRSDWDVMPRLELIAAPTLVLAGRRDPIVPFEETEEIASRVAGASLVAVDDASHSVLLEGGREVLDRVVAFLDPSIAPNT